MRAQSGECRLRLIKTQTVTSSLSRCLLLVLDNHLELDERRTDIVLDSHPMFTERLTERLKLRFTTKAHEGQHEGSLRKRFKVESFKFNDI